VFLYETHLVLMRPLSSQIKTIKMIKRAGFVAAGPEIYGY
jgi:hypothetical protein